MAAVIVLSPEERLCCKPCHPLKLAAFAARSLSSLASTPAARAVLPLSVSSLELLISMTRIRCIALVGGSSDICSLLLMLLTFSLLSLLRGAIFAMSTAPLSSSSCKCKRSVANKRAANMISNTGTQCDACRLHAHYKITATLLHFKLKQLLVKLTSSASFRGRGLPTLPVVIVVVVAVAPLLPPPTPVFWPAFLVADCPVPMAVMPRRPASLSAGTDTHSSPVVEERWQAASLARTSHGHSRRNICTRGRGKAEGMKQWRMGGRRDECKRWTEGRAIRKTAKHE